MKKIILVIIIIITIILGSIFIIHKNNKKYDYEIENISKYNYFIYKENENYGVIDINGNTIIEAKYENLVIPNPRKRHIYLLQWRKF